MQNLGLRYALMLAFGGLLAINCGGEEDKAPGGTSGKGGSSTSGGNGGKSGKSTGKSGNGGKSSSSGGDAGTGDTGGDGPDPGAGGRGGSSGGDAGAGSGGTSGETGNEGGTGAVVEDRCTLPWSALAPNDTCDIEALEVDDSIVLTGDITQDLTLAADKAYVLSGPTRIMQGVTVTIEPCVKILGEGPTSVLAVLAGDDGDNDPSTNGAPGPGGKLIAEGEPDRPIVFTSSEEAGNRLAGDWGGLILLGNAFVNNWDTTLDARPLAEGLVAAEPYGWKTDEYDDESSGVLRYVRVEFVGREITADNETNGITLGGVGSGTELDHVMVSHSIDDCFEWFGGAVSAHHLVANDCDDDMFDADAGYSGRVQFAFGLQGDQTAETDPSGFEMDGKNAPNFTNAQWSNVTLCGGRAQLNNVGMVLRKSLAGSIMNALVTGFETGVALRDGSTTEMTHSVLFENPAAVADTTTETWFTGQEGNSVEGPAGFCDCWAELPVPFAETALEGGTPEGFPDESATYIGAFDSASLAANWMNAPWVSFAQD